MGFLQIKNKRGNIYEKVQKRVCGRSCTGIVHVIYDRMPKTHEIYTKNEILIEENI